MGSDPGPSAVPASIKAEVEGIRDILGNLPDDAGRRAREMSRVFNRLDGIERLAEESDGDAVPEWVTWVIHEIARMLLSEILDICLSETKCENRWQSLTRILGTLYESCAGTPDLPNESWPRASASTQRICPTWSLGVATRASTC